MADDQIEYRPRISGRCRHGFEHVDGRRLVLDPFAVFVVAAGQFFGAFLQRVPHLGAAYSDHRLLGEGFQQRDMSIGESPRLAMHCDDDTKCRALVHQWHRQNFLVTECLRFLRPVRQYRIEVANMVQLPVHDCPLGKIRPGRPLRVTPCEGRENFRLKPLAGAQMDLLAIELVDRAMGAAGQVHRAAQDRVENRLRVAA